MLQNGALKIVDRKKHIFKLAQGEYLAPEKLENIYSRSRLVAQCFVEGNSLEVSDDESKSELWVLYMENCQRFHKK